jgi:hypothetical protein
MKYKLVYIEWMDAIDDANGWKTMDEVTTWAHDAFCWVKQVGFVLEENKKYLLLCSKIGDTGNNLEDSEIQYSVVQKIPKTWIRKRKVLKC